MSKVFRYIKLEEYIASKFEDMAGTVSFKQWTSVDTIEFTNQTTNVAEYNEKLVNKLTTLIPNVLPKVNVFQRAEGEIG